MARPLYVLWAMPGVDCLQASCGRYGEPHRHPIKIKVDVSYRQALAEFDWRRRHPGHLSDFRIGRWYRPGEWKATGPWATPYDDCVDATWLARWAPTVMPMEKPDTTRPLV